MYWSSLLPAFGSEGIQLRTASDACAAGDGCSAGDGCGCLAELDPAACLVVCETEVSEAGEVGFRGSVVASSFSLDIGYAQVVVKYFLNRIITTFLQNTNYVLSNNPSVCKELVGRWR